jgi:hypothetical protein
MVDQSHSPWKNGLRTGVLRMDINVVFASAGKERPVNLMKVRQMEGDYIRGMESLLSDRMLQMIIEGNAIERHLRH